MPVASTETAPDATLLRLVASGGVRSAGAWLVQEHAEDVYALCRAIVRDRETAEDLAHDAFARALDALTTYRGEASPRTWLLTIARHRCFDYLRQKKRERALIFDDAGPGESHADDAPLIVDHLASTESLRRALEALDEGERAIVVLRHVHAMDYAAIADVFGAKEGAVRMRLSRATAKMRAAIEEGEAVLYSLDEVGTADAVEAPAARARIAPIAPSAPASAPRAQPMSPMPAPAMPMAAMPPAAMPPAAAPYGSAPLPPAPGSAIPSMGGAPPGFAPPPSAPPRPTGAPAPVPASVVFQSLSVAVAPDSLAILLRELPSVTLARRLAELVASR